MVKPAMVGNLKASSGVIGALAFAPALSWARLAPVTAKNAAPMAAANNHFLIMNILSVVMVGQ
jgi:hypothetical protein